MALLLGIAFLLPLGAQAPSSDVVSVDVALGPFEGGESAARDALPEDLQVRIGGQEVRTWQRLPGEWSQQGRRVLYLDLASSRPATIRRVASALLEQTAALASGSGIEIVQADPEPRPLSRAVAEADLESTLSRLFVQPESADEVAAIRRDYRGELEKGEEDPSELAAAAYELEVEARQRQIDGLIRWVAAQRSEPGPHVLALANDNLDLDARSFYLGPRAPVAAVRWPPEPDTTSLASALASYGWTLLVIGPQEAEDERRLSNAASPDLPIGFRLSVGGRDREARQAPAEASELGLDQRVDGGLARIAEPTGGAVVSDMAELAARLEAFSSRPGIRLDGVALSRGETADLRVERADGEPVRSASLVGRPTPRAVAEARARRAMSGESTEAELAMRSTIEFEPGHLREVESRLEARTDLFELRRRLGTLSRGSFRVTVGVRVESGELLLRHEEVRDVDLEGRDEWLYDSTLRLPGDTDGAVVLVELLDTGDWGESFASFVRRRPDSAPAPVDVAPAVPLLTGRRFVRLTPPAEPVAVGRVAIAARVDERVRRLVYMLDGRRVEVRRRGPWGTTLDLGANPTQRMLVAIAYDRDGRELGRDGLVLNDAARSFDVRITSPAAGHRVGPVDVEAAVTTPQEAVVDRVEFFWQDELVAALRRPPWRQRVFVPVASQPGFIRVAAHLADGRVAEDVVLMNADRFEAEVTVNLVELYVVVSDRSGQPVRDLEASDFEVLEEGLPQELESFEIAGDLPITVGLALDSSLSLFLKMPEVKEAATDFVDGLVEHRDRAFLVGFSSHPRLISGTTTNLESIAAGIDRLSPEGTTALWEAVMMSLLQLQETAGRKALIVFYDGDDEDEDFSYGTSLKLAESVGVPIYFIVMNDAAARTGGRSFATKNRASRLERIARVGGGRVFYVPTSQNLTEIFGAITAELRAHYLLTYYPEPLEGQAPDEPASRWRPIEVRVKKPGLVARTLAGYEKL